jgi:hypothetical protein
MNKPWTCFMLMAATMLTARITHAGEKCYDFSGMATGTEYPVDGTAPIPISIGEILVRPLKLDGNEVGANNRFFKVAPDSQKIAGGTAPEMYGKNVALQMKPKEPVKEITLKFSHQPGPERNRAAFVEVNNERREWQGSFGKLDGKVVGQDTEAARFSVREAAVGSSNWVSGELRLTAKGEAIQSFTLGAAELRLDDVCFAR